MRIQKISHQIIDRSTVIPDQVIAVDFMPIPQQHLGKHQMVLFGEGNGIGERRFKECDVRYVEFARIE